jgi:ligand-binding sensor domain-containing protein
MFLLLTGLSVYARNLDNRIMQHTSEEQLVVRAVYVDPQGVTWFGTNRGLLRMDQLTRQYYTDADGLTGNGILELTGGVAGPQEGLWVATDAGATLVTFDAAGLTGSVRFTTQDGLLDEEVTDIAVDSRSRKFFGSASGITWIHGDTVEYLTYSDFNTSMVNAPVRKLELHNDTLYIAADGGIGRFVSGVDGVSGASRWTSEYGMTPLSGDIRSVFVDSKGHQWFGTDQGVEEHIGHEAKENWILYTTAEGLVDNRVISIAEEPGEGAMWFGTLGGVSQLKAGVWTSYTEADGLLNDTVYDIGFDAEGRVWFATGSGVCSLKGGAFNDFYTSVERKMASRLEMQAWYLPGTHSIAVSYSLVEATRVSARLYTIHGMLVGQWFHLPSMPGQQQTELPLSATGQEFTNGIYILHLVHERGSDSRKLLISR